MPTYTSWGPCKCLLLLFPEQLHKRCHIFTFFSIIEIRSLLNSLSTTLLDLSISDFISSILACNWAHSSLCCCKVNLILSGVVLDTGAFGLAGVVKRVIHSLIKNHFHLTFRIRVFWIRNNFHWHSVLLAGCVPTTDTRANFKG